MAKVGSLLIDIRANVAQLQQDMTQGRSVLERSLGQMSGALKTFGGALSGYFAAGAVIRFGRETVKAAAEVGRSADQIGITTDALQELRYAASTVGVEAQDMDQILRDLGDRMGDAASGSKTWQEAFKALGVEYEAAPGVMRPVVDVLTDVADGMANADSDATRLFRSMELFGDQGAKVLPVLKRGAAGVDELRVRARELGHVMSAETVSAADDLQRNLTTLGQQGQGVANAMMAGLLPTVSDLSNRLLGASAAAENFSQVTRITEGAAHGIVSALSTAEEGVTQIATAFLAGGDALYEVASGDIAGAATVAGHAGKEMADSFRDWHKFVTANDSAERLGESLVSVAHGFSAANRALIGFNANMREMARQSFDAAEKFSARVRARVEVEKEAARRAAQERARLAEDSATRAVDAEMRAASVLAGLTDSKLDDIEASYARQYEMIRRQLETETATEAERTALLMERRALELAETKAIADEKARIEAEAHAGAEETKTAKSKTEDRTRADASVQLAQQTAQQVGTAFLDVAFSPMNEALSRLDGTLGKISNIVGRLMQQLSSKALMMALNASTGGASGVAGGLFGFSQGGLVDGPGTETSDSIVARLSRREFVIRASSAKRIGLPALRMMNSLGSLPRAKMPAFAMGGLLMARAPAFAEGGLVGSGAGARLAMSAAPVSVTIAPQVNFQGTGTLMHRDILQRELGPTLRQMAVEQTDSIIRQLGLRPADVSARG